MGARVVMGGPVDGRRMLELLRLQQRLPPAGGGRPSLLFARPGHCSRAEDSSSRAGESAAALRQGLTPLSAAAGVTSTMTHPAARNHLAPSFSLETLSLPQPPIVTRFPEPPTTTTNTINHRHHRPPPPPTTTTNRHQPPPTTTRQVRDTVGPRPTRPPSERGHRGRPGRIPHQSGERGVGVGVGVGVGEAARRRGGSEAGRASVSRMGDRG
jgi:hypothetical protein